MFGRSPREVTDSRPTSFLGGVDELDVGDSAYVTLDLEAGPYGWVLHPFRSDAEPLVEQFTVE